MPWKWRRLLHNFLALFIMIGKIYATKMGAFPYFRAEVRELGFPPCFMPLSLKRDTSKLSLCGSYNLIICAASGGAWITKRPFLGVILTSHFIFYLVEIILSIILSIRKHGRYLYLQIWLRVMPLVSQGDRITASLLNCHLLFFRYSCPLDQNWKAQIASYHFRILCKSCPPDQIWTAIV